MANADLFDFSFHPYNRNRDVVHELKGKKNDAPTLVRTALSRCNFSLLAFMLAPNFKYGMLQRDIGSWKRLWAPVQDSGSL